MSFRIQSRPLLHQNGKASALQRVPFGEKSYDEGRERACHALPTLRWTAAGVCGSGASGSLQFLRCVTGTLLSCEIEVRRGLGGRLSAAPRALRLFCAAIALRAMVRRRSGTVSVIGSTRV